MDSNITIYNSYNKGINTIKGSFPIFNNTQYLACIRPQDNALSDLKIIQDLYEQDSSYYLITEDSTVGNNILVDLQTVFLDPIYGPQSNNYNLVVGNQLDLEAFLLSRLNTKDSIKNLINQQQVTFAQNTQNPGYPKLSILTSTRPPVPGIGLPPYKGATVTISYDCGFYGDQPSNSMDLYISQDRTLGTLIATVFNNKGSYKIINLLGNTTYFLTGINSDKIKTSTLEIVTPAYLYVGYISTTGYSQIQTV